MSELGFQSRLQMKYEAALEKVTEALKAEGFGVLTSIDVKETMQKKLNIDFRKYTILGACNPPLAHKALTARPDIGLLLPCNVIIYEDGDETIVNIIDPLSMTDFIQDAALDTVAAEARQRLQRVTQALNG
ncbi:MAG: ABC transporter ATP-binding protein [Chloroflexi bacterium HGW-Chloroflexi-6]|nr:MAG: ABC transporter ATP-binding protein [Chloroflexi bacterium HGW-Chloroflexi-6]